ncbi:hypothetical protein P280DRAFT_534834 [Massarina eburnea CBS 473.64]|uniref:Uncharacterized protein n=1 Tax=Massarina eburnea CBS 473.64 TaxID=1395130 RepID=A0A6A6SB19_9PLEO|nr:hypothetical protein P280DRAFT_534834 [Massarina eburnea CBS 473.64]
MAAVMSPHAYLSTHEDVDEFSQIDISHLSGMTLSNFTTTTKRPQPQIHLINTSSSVSVSKGSLSSGMGQSKRSSMASVSTTKSQLRHANHLLIDMLHNIQTELEAHRTTMLDIQHRVSHLENESEVGGEEDTNLAALQALEGEKSSQRNSRPVSPESLSWWQACQAFARNSEPPISATEFLRTPKRFSGFNFDWPLGPLQSQHTYKSCTPLAKPPQIDDLPPLTPTSEEGDNSDLDTPSRHDVSSGEEIPTSMPKMRAADVEDEIDIEDEIRGQEVEFDKKKMPASPMIMPPPTRKTVETVQGVGDAVEVGKPAVTGNPQRYYKGVRSLNTYRALLKHKPTEREHQVLIHFHRRTDITHVNTTE